VTSRYALLVNPTSGRGRFAGAVDDVRRQLDIGGMPVEVIQGSDADEAAQLARTAVESGVEALLVMGGDGLVHLAAQAAAYTPVTLGIIPTGSGNDVARYLGLPRRKPAAAVDTILRGRTRTIDLAKTSGGYYVTVLASGFDSLVNERANTMTWPSGQMRYNLATLAELRVLQPLNYTLELDGGRHQVEAIVVAVGNGPSYGGGLRMCEGAELDDGLLDVVIISPLRRLQVVALYPRLFNGSHVRHWAYEHHRVQRVSLAAPGIVAYADGERIGALPLTVDVAPAALTVYVS
jgi:diacylglycerol kinase (ATP)